MKLLFLISGDRVPSARFRMLQLIPHLRALGHRCTIASSFPQTYDYIPWIGFRPSQQLKRLVRYGHLLRAACGNYDAVVLERELFHNPTWDMERRFRQRAKTLVWDVDDAIFLNFPEKFPQLAKLADLVIAGNQNLKDRIQPLNSNIVIVPTCVDLDLYRPRQEAASAARRCPVVGWMGTTGNIAYLRDVAPALNRLAQRHTFEFRVIAGERGELDELPLDHVRVRFIPWNPATEAQDVAEFDVGLMPLTDDAWSPYKCGLKLLQYMAVGIPGVASPVGVNSEIITSGKDGLLAQTSEQWEQALDRVLRDPSWRQQAGKEARRTVEQRYSVAANLPRWIEAVETACSRARDGRAQELPDRNQRASDRE